VFIAGLLCWPGDPGGEGQGKGKGKGKANISFCDLGVETETAECASEVLEGGDRTGLGIRTSPVGQEMPTHRGSA
jgi:hypothetical protein